MDENRPENDIIDMTLKEAIRKLCVISGICFLIFNLATFALQSAFWGLWICLITYCFLGNYCIMYEMLDRQKIRLGLKNDNG